MSGLSDADGGRGGEGEGEGAHGRRKRLMSFIDQRLDV